MLVSPVRLLFLSLLVTALSACGGGGSSSSDTANPDIDILAPDVQADVAGDTAIDQTKPDDTQGDTVPDSSVDVPYDSTPDAHGETSTDTPGEADVVPPDTAAPVVYFEAPLDGETVTGSVSVEVTATDDSGVDRVEISVNGELKTTLTTTPYVWAWDSSALVGGPYQLTATAYDEAGNHATDDITVVVQGACGEDNDCPPSSVTIITPVDGAKVCGTITLEATATDDQGLAKIVFYVDGVPLGADEDAPYQRDWTTGSVSNGAHEIKAEAHDAADQTAFTQITVTVDNSGGACDNLPNVTITKPELQGSAAYVTALVSVEAKASDDIGVTKVQFFVDNGMVSEDTSVPYKFDWNTDDFDEGAHTLKAIARDTSDQMAVHQIAVTIDRTPPVVQVTMPAQYTPYSGELPLSTSVTDNFAVAEVVIALSGNGKNYQVTLTEAPYTSTFNASAWPSGTYTVTATATDEAGLTAAAARDFWLDRPPSVTFVTPANNQTVTGPITVKVNATDDLGLSWVDFEVDGDREGSFENDGTFAWTPPYVRGDYVLTATAEDDRGQDSQAEVTAKVDWPFVVEPQICATDCAPLQPMQEMTGTVSLTVLANDDAGPVQAVDMYVDGTHAEVVNAEPFNFQWDSATVGDGQHVLRFVATGTAGATGEASVTVVANNCDLDDDTYLAKGGVCGGSDCNDSVNTIHPNTLDMAGDGIDQNCDGIDGQDGDGDGFASLTSGGTDCDDTKNDVHPTAIDTLGDGADKDCDGFDGVDGDADGYASFTSGGSDCDDMDARIHPGAIERPNQKDDNCDGNVDEGIPFDCDYNWCTIDDALVDGLCVSGTARTCDDGDMATNDSCQSDGETGFGYCAYQYSNGLCPEQCDDGDKYTVDACIYLWWSDGYYGCASAPDADADGAINGWFAEGIGYDCDDYDSAVHEGATEVCNGVDDDCSGVVDENPQQLCGGTDICSDGVCTPCVPQCDGKSCGSDGCGSYCGHGCNVGTSCIADGTCVQDPAGCGNSMGTGMSCYWYCGGKSSWGGCYCDPSCSERGDCCPDRDACCG